MSEKKGSIPGKFMDSNSPMTSRMESIGSPGGSPWAAKQVGGAGVPFVGGYDTTTLTSPGIFGVEDGFKVTSASHISVGAAARQVSVPVPKPLQQLKIQH
uniref:Uncharacterized protein n=1 Tax=Romanomermis culicivorax TaxID=13658 RepID=A0A915JPZ5_ROMCU